MADLLARRIDGITALVTGANRGLGKQFTQALLDAGAAKVYAGARDPSTIEVTDTASCRCDWTSPTQAISPRPLATAPTCRW